LPRNTVFRGILLKGDEPYATCENNKKKKIFKAAYIRAPLAHYVGSGLDIFNIIRVHAFARRDFNGFSRIQAHTFLRKFTDGRLVKLSVYLSNARFFQGFA
jgi:hypothetical protein